MKHPLTALFLACLIFGSGLTFIGMIDGNPSYGSAQTKVDIHSTRNVGDIVSAIEALKRPDVRISSHVTTFTNPLVRALLTSLGLFLVTGVVLLIFKGICRVMGITPTL